MLRSRSAMYNILTISCFVLAVAGVISGCGSKTSAVDPGSVTIIGADSTSGFSYDNVSLGMHMTLPAAWVASNQQQEPAGNRPDAPVKLLFLEREAPTPELASAAPQLICVATRLGKDHGMKRGSDLMEHTRAYMDSARTRYDVQPGYHKKIIGGLSFDAMEYIAGGRRFVQYAAILKNEYALSLETSFVMDEDRASLDTLMAGISFEQ